MKRYVEFQVNRNGKYITPCGSFSYLILDARRNINNELKEIIEIAKKRNFDKFLVESGDFKNSKTIREVIV